MVFEGKKDGMYDGLNGSDDLEEGELYAAEDSTGVSVCYLREKIPGRYAAIIYKSVDSEEDVPSELRILVNRDTGKSYFDAGVAGVYAISGMDMVIYHPHGFDGYNDEEYLISSLKKAKVISNEKEYITTIFNFWKNQIGEAGSWIEEPDPNIEGQIQGDHIQLDLMKKEDPHSVVGTFLIHTKNFTITDKHTGEVVYQGPIPTYKEMQVTKKCRENNPENFK